MTVMIPFGLTLLEPVPARSRVTDSSTSVVLDQQRQMAVFNGRPLCEQTAADLLMGSSPTETDGKDPIAVDSDPVYD